MTFGKYLTFLREKYKYKISYFCRDYNYDCANICNMKKGRRKPWKDKIKVIKLGVDLGASRDEINKLYELALKTRVK